MKVIIVGTAYPYRGGLSAFNERLAHQYLRQGAEVEIYTFTLQYPAFLFPGKSQFSTESAPKGLKIFRKINAINPFNWLCVGREIKRKKPDILITKFWLPFMSPCLGTIERVVKKNKKTTIISILDNLIPHEKRIGDKIFAQYFVKSTEGFVAMSKSVLADLDIFDTKKKRIFCPHPIYDHYGEKLPVQEAKTALSLTLDSKYILFFGLIRPYKGLDLLLDALTDERLRALDVKLIVAGEFYEDAVHYLEFIEQNNLQDKVILHTEFIPDSKVNLYFSACDIVAQPYRSATQSGVTQIAFHFEKPMLVTEVGGLAEIVAHEKMGYVVEVDPKQIADALIAFFTNNRQEAFEKNVAVEKSKYSWEKMTKAIDSLL